MKENILVIWFIILVLGCIGLNHPLDSVSKELELPQQKIPDISENATRFRVSSAYQVTRGSDLRLLIIVKHLGEEFEPIDISNLTVKEVIEVLEELERKSKSDTINLESITVVQPRSKMAIMGEDGRWKEIEEYHLVHKPSNQSNDNFTLANPVLGAIGPAQQVIDDFEGEDSPAIRRYIELIENRENLNEEQLKNKIERIVEDIETFKNYERSFQNRNLYRVSIDLPFPEDIPSGEVEVKVIFNYSRTINGYTFHNLSATAIPNGKKNTVI